MRLLLILALCAGGCVYQGPPVTFTGAYTSPDGVMIGGSVRLDPTFARQKK